MELGGEARFDLVTKGCRQAFIELLAQNEV
jgi:hypothetical protein